LSLFLEMAAWKGAHIMRALISGNAVRTFGLGGFCLALLAATGCGKSNGNLKGTVKKGDKPIMTGDLTFHIGKEEINVPIKDGAYEAKGLPLGEATITVNSPKPQTQAGAGAGFVPPGKDTGGVAKEMEKKQKEQEKLLKQWVEIPEKYKDQAKTPLKTEIKKGDNPDFDIKLED
jgi:hypothetical protein